MMKKFKLIFIMLLVISLAIFATSCLNVTINYPGDGKEPSGELNPEENAGPTEDETPGGEKDPSTDEKPDEGGNTENGDNNGSDETPNEGEKPEEGGEGTGSGENPDKDPENGEKPGISGDITVGDDPIGDDPTGDDPIGDDPTGDDPTDDDPTDDKSEMDFETFINLSQEEQLVFFNGFETMNDFFAWYNAAKAEYEEQNPGIDIGDGNVDIGGITGGSNG